MNLTVAAFACSKLTPAALQGRKVKGFEATDNEEQRASPLCPAAPVDSLGRIGTVAKRSLRRWVKRTSETGGGCVKTPLI